MTAITTERFATDLDTEHLVDNLEYALTSADQSDKRIQRSDAPPQLIVSASINRLLRFALEDWACIALFWAGMIYTPPWLYPLWALLIAGRLHAFGVILHDLTHLPLRGKTLKIRLIEILVGYPSISTLNAMRYHHLRHHRDSGMDTDPYYKKGVESNPFLYFLMTVRGVILGPFWCLRGYVGVLALFIPGLRNVYGHIFLQDRSKDDLTHSNEIITCAREEIGQVIAHTAVFVLAWFHFEMVLFFYFIPVIITGLLNAHRVLMEHRYLVARDRNIETIIATTVDHNLDPLGRLFLAPRNIGYHIVHHIHPTVALDRLPALRAWYRKTYPNLYPTSEGLFVAGR